MLRGLPFSTCTFPTEHDQKECFAYGSCGFVARSVGQNLQIFCESDSGFSLLLAFEHPSSDITHLSWYNGSKLMTPSQPYLVISSSQGRVEIFDVSERKVHARTPKQSSPYISIKWSEFSESVFFCGTEDGHLTKFEFCRSGSTYEIVKIWDIEVKFPISYITTEHLSGDQLVVSSRTGSVVLVNRIRAEIPVISQRFDLKTEISFCEYYQNHPNLVLFGTPKGAIVYAIEEETPVPIIAMEGVRRVYLLDTEIPSAMIVKDSSLTLIEWRDEQWENISSLTFGTGTATPEITSFDFVMDRFIFTTSSKWITVVERRRKRLFVTKRCPLLDAKPVDWEGFDARFAFLLENGKLMISRRSPDALETAGESIRTQKEPKSQNMSRLGIPRTHERSSFGKNVPGLSALPTAKRFGQDLTMQFVFAVDASAKLNRVAWLDTSRLMVWTHNSTEKAIYIVDIGKHTAEKFIHKRVKNIGMRLSEISFNRERTMCSIVFGDVMALFVSTNTKSENIQVVMQNAPFRVCFSKDDDEVALVARDGRVKVIPMRTNESEPRRKKRHFRTEVRGDITAAYWNNAVFVIGTSTGVIYQAERSGQTKEICSGRYAITDITSCGCESLLVMDEKNNATMISNHTPTLISENVEHIRAIKTETFLIHRFGTNMLEVKHKDAVQKPFLPSMALKCPGMKHYDNSTLMKAKPKPESIDDVRTMCRCFGLPCLYSVINVHKQPVILKKSLKMMTVVCSLDPKLATFVSRLLIMIGKDEQSKVKRLQMSSENTQSFVTEILKTALFANQMSSDIIDQVALKLMAIDHMDDAMDVLLISKNWQKAVTSFVGTRDSYRAQLIARLHARDIRRDFATKIGRRMMNDNDPGGCFLLSERGALHDLIRIIPKSARLAATLLRIYADAFDEYEEEEEEDADDNYSL